jgi:hypothetical protein
VCCEAVRVKVSNWKELRELSVWRTRPGLIDHSLHQGATMVVIFRLGGLPVREFLSFRCLQAGLVRAVLVAGETGGVLWLRFRRHTLNRPEGLLCATDTVGIGVVVNFCRAATGLPQHL